MFAHNIRLSAREIAALSVLHLKEVKSMKKKVSKVLAVVLAALILFVTGCNSQPSSSGTTSGGADAGAASGADTASAAKKKVGVSMPTKSLQRWNQDGENMKSSLEAAGYEVDLQYGGENEIPLQVSQIENMISSGCEVLVIAAIDGESLTEVLANAKANNIPVIAYDRLIMNTDAVTYYATFDNWKVGTMQGEYLKRVLDLDNAAGPFNIEFFTGDPGDNNINFFFDGAMSVLQPYLDSGKLVCPSGQTEKLTVATEGWSSERSQSRMENLISSNGYSPSGTKLDAVMCSNDSTAQGVTTALTNAGYTKDNFPYITGQDCDIVSVKNMIAGTQSMSVFKDTRTLANKVVEMVDAILKGSEPPVNDNETYDNGTGIIPSYLCDPVEGSAANYRELLIDTGYYKEEDVIG
jgi:putative multiple sugar transport system substrate-binding protein